MGTFNGYLIPGILCLIFGFRWMYCSFRRYFLCHREVTLPHARSRRFKSSITFPVSCCPRFPLEAAVMFVFVTVSSVGELIWAVRLGFFENSLPLTMYSFYGMAAVVMLLRYFGLPIVPDADYACFIVSFLVNAFVVHRDLPGKSPVEFQAQQNMMLVMLATAAVFALEMRYRHNPLMPLFRAVCFSLNGSWLVMQAFILYSPWGAWPAEDPKYIKMVTISFVGHIASNLQLVGLVGGLAMGRVKVLSAAEVSIALEQEGLGQKGHKDHDSANKSTRNDYHLVNSDEEV